MSKNNKKKGGKKYILLTLFALIIILILAKRCGSDKSINVTVQHPERKTIVETVPANGKVQPVTEVKISPDVSGEIVELHVKEGDAVKRGDLLIKIKQDIYISAVDQALASLNSVKANYKQQEAQTLRTKQNYDRNKQLYELKTISKAEFESASAEWQIAQEQLSAAKFNISSAEARVKEARENLSKTIIYAPMDGIVSKLSVELGERVVGTSQMAGTEMLRVANFDAMEVLVNVNENDIIRLKVGDSAEVTIDAYLDRVFNGYVTEVANSSNSSTSTSLDMATTFEVKVRLAPESYSDLFAENPTPFRPGMSASVQIKTSQSENVLVMPLGAVTNRTDLLTDKNYPQVVFSYNTKNQTVEAVGVKVGLQDITDIEIKDGITDSTLVVVGPDMAIRKNLQNGTKVKATIKK